KNLLCKENIYNVFLAYLLLTLKKKLISLANGTTFLELSKQNLTDVEIPLPPLDEQQAIAETLTAFDDEIASLEAERDKITQIRDGAMNDLLTGKVRLT
ncbi:MAG: restriction endonuclease subunit S, partial [Synergistaceae bacterium]|nr:restriction endonuclease subunit S [Synergistaceae bacterium]